MRKMQKDIEGVVILALERNCEPLATRFGGSLRIIAPDIVGARATRWLDEQTIQTDELAKFYQSRDYKIFPESVLSGEE
ncbi:hypothetical protein WAI453_006596 [Rhynchosporium graminicola]